MADFCLWLRFGMVWLEIWVWWLTFLWGYLFLFNIWRVGVYSILIWLVIYQLAVLLLYCRFFSVFSFFFSSNFPYRFVFTLILLSFFLFQSFSYIEFTIFTFYFLNLFSAILLIFILFFIWTLLYGYKRYHRWKFGKFVTRVLFFYFY